MLARAAIKLRAVPPAAARTADAAVSRPTTPMPVLCSASQPHAIARRAAATTSAPRSTSTTTVPPDPWAATRRTMAHFWSRYGHYVRLYLIWTTVGSIALNLMWTRQERDELNEDTKFCVKRLTRQLNEVRAQRGALERALASPVAEEVEKVGASAEGKDSASWWPALLRSSRSGTTSEPAAPSLPAEPVVAAAAEPPAASLAPPAASAPPVSDPVATGARSDGRRPRIVLY
ncbi:hypothetical protein AMAG_00046 [Allomyces macrogynus ATCC 38327]|uniref:Uncharacterized protein n=1 Tax=Allomyces macrogynus (strain ATCC 38327) TaxID=578462 RepID=A0A0L0RUJ8_ALLM3|nr:hypothetical protein AMAG_00046 [Allomyces macrogynus ATCC 38327]|eukprot:KNE54042.1 hypothetical protein AMAG_00046 [Allomyces macrogynus ATCC 38327]